MTRGAGWPGARSRAAAVLAAVLLLPAAARAELTGRGEVRLGLQRFEYAEYGGAGSASLDREDGWLPAVSGELELRQGPLFGRAGVRIGVGSVAYHGHTQSLADPSFDGLPLRSRSDASLVSGELQGGGFVDEARRLALFAALGARRWTRDLRDATVVGRNGNTAAVLGLSEIYSWYELQAGVRFTFLAQARRSWDAEARLVRTAGAELSVDLGRVFGVDQTARMGLGSRTGWLLATTFRQDVSAAMFLVVSLFAEGHSFGASDLALFQDAGNVTRAISEPRSETFAGGLDVGVGGRF